MTIPKRTATPIHAMITGLLAIESSKPLYVRRLDGRWVLADDAAATRARAAYMPAAQLGIYGVAS